MSTPRPVSADDKFERHYRQQLSVLMDGELASDEARFLLRRLEHDDELSGCHERWQLIGDALRGRASAPAPLDFSARVRQAVAQEAVAGGSASAVVARTATRGGWRRWGGGAALAASVAAMAVLVTQQQLAPQVPSEPQVIATQAQLPVLAPVPAPAIDTAAVPARAVASAPARQPAVRDSTPVARKPAPAARAQAPERAIASVPALPAVTPDPFSHPAQVLPSRPWPRSAVGAGLPRNAFTASTSGAAAGAFYPFDPEPLAGDALAPLLGERATTE